MFRKNHHLDKSPKISSQEAHSIKGTGPIIHQKTLEGEVSIKNSEETKLRKRPIPTEEIINSKVPGRRLQLFKDSWKDDKWSYSVVSKGLGWKWEQRPPRCKLFCQTITPSILAYQEKLLQANVIRPIKSIKFQGRLFQVRKRTSNEMRTILDLSDLNTHIRCPKFRMNSTQDIRNCLSKGMYTSSIDIQDAFWNIPIHPHFSRYLGFILNRKKFVFQALPNGLNLGPRVFTKLMAVIIRSLRLKNVNVIAYLDDLLIYENSPSLCTKNTSLVLQELEKRGFLVNYTKSRLKPSQNFEHLGILWNTNSGTLSIPSRHRKSTLKSVKNIIKRRKVTLKEFQWMLVKTNFTTIVDPPSKCRAKNWYVHLKKLRKNQRTSLPHSLLQSLKGG